MMPPSKPQALRPLVTAAANARWRKSGKSGPLPLFCLVGVRGYYFQTMGDPLKNDRGIYDDGLFILTRASLLAFNANVDPSGYRRGTGSGAGKGMASLKNGVWLYAAGLHPLRGGYPAFRQAAPVTVLRDGAPDYEETGNFGINIHRGGRGTSSEGCQTLPPDQWPAFHAALMAEISRSGKPAFHYLLVDGPLS
jgi:hypothetical protein